MRSSCECELFAAARIVRHLAYSILGNFQIQLIELGESAGNLNDLRVSYLSIGHPQVILNEPVDGAHSLASV